MRFCLSHSLSSHSGIFSTYDCHLSDERSQPENTEPIQITVTFVERYEGEWPEELIQVLNDCIGIRDDKLLTIIFRISSKYDRKSGNVFSDWEFLDAKGNPLGARARNNRYLTELQRRAPMFYLAAFRDTAQQFRAQSPFWGPSVRSLMMDTAERSEIEAALAALNQRIPVWREAFAVVLDSLKRTGRLVPLGDEHGEDTQSLAVICLFRAFLKDKLADSPQTEPILALEEPEAHLNSEALRAVGALLSGLRGQKIIATPYGDLLATVPLTAIRRLSRGHGTTRVQRIAPDTLSLEEVRKLDHDIRLSRSSLLCARLWLMVEGETEVLLFEECARIMGHNLFAIGICCVEFSVVGVEKFINLADQLGIDWLIFAGRDQSDDSYFRLASRQLNGRDTASHIRQLPFGTIEAYLCSAGFGDIYETNVSARKASSIGAARGTEEYWEQVLKAQSDGKRRPDLVAEVISRIEDSGAATSLPW